MKPRTLVILLIILGILAGSGALIILQKAPESSEGRLGTHLFGQIPANEIASIIIKGPDGAVSLVKKVDRWVVENRFDYPADFSKISDFALELKQVKTGREFESSEDTLKRLSLKDPDDSEALEQEKGIRVLLKDKEGALLASVLLGKTRIKEAGSHIPDGRYVRLGQESKIYLIDKHFASFHKEPSAWLEKGLAEVGANEVRKVSCLSADGKKVRYTFERPEKGKDLEPVNLPADRKIKKSTLNRLAGALSSLRMEDVVEHLDGPESIATGFPSRIEYHLFNGIIYRVYPGDACSEADLCHLRLEVDYQRPPQALEAKQLNERLSPWVYVIPEWQHSIFMTDLDQLLEKPEEERKE